MQQRSTGMIVTNRDSREKALKITARENNPHFRASKDLVSNMKKKNGLAYRESIHTSFRSEDTEEDKISFRVTIRFHPWLVDCAYASRSGTVVVYSWLFDLTTRGTE